jgi:aminomethyltransferase
MGYVQSQYAAIGTEIFVSVRNTPLKAQVVKIPFV